MATTSLPKGLKQLGYGPSFRDQICSMLEEINLFTDFSHRELLTLASYMHAFEAVPGTVILREGNRDSYMCLVVEGKLDVIKEREEGEHRQLAVIRAGKAVGEMSLIDEQPHSATVVAKTDCTLLLFTKRSFERIADDHPRLAFDVLWKLAETLSHRLRQTSGKLVDLL